MKKGNLSSDEILKTHGISDDIICKDCTNKVGNTMFSNDYHKSSCKVYEHPDSKPMEILLDGQSCIFYEKEKN